MQSSELLMKGPHYTQFKVQYLGNGANSGSVPEQSVITTSLTHSFTVSNNAFTKTHHDFLYWKDQNGKMIDPGASLVANYDNVNYTLEAHWTPQYHITYNLNAPTGTAPTVDRPDDWVSTLNNATTTLPNASLSNYKFRGWFTKPNDENSRVGSVGTTYRPQGNITLYARWGVKVHVYKSLQAPNVHTEVERNIKYYKSFVNNGLCTKAGLTNYLSVKCGSIELDFSKTLFPLNAMGETITVGDYYLPYGATISISAGVIKRGYDSDSRYAEINVNGTQVARTPWTGGYWTNTAIPIYISSADEKDDYDKFCSYTYTIQGNCNDIILNCEWDGNQNSVNYDDGKFTMYSSWWDIYLS